MKMNVMKAVVALSLVIFLSGCATNIKDGTTYLKGGNYKKAVTCFEKEIAGEKNLAEAYRGLGIAKYELGEYEEALAALKMSEKQGAETNATFYSIVAACYVETEAYAEALEAYGKVLKYEKDASKELIQEARYNEIAICLEMSDWELAKAKVASYVKDYPEDSRMDKTVDFLETR